MSDNMEYLALENHLKDTAEVEKSRPLLLMKSVPFELGELKVLDTYISRINSENPNTRTVIFSKEEYEELIGVENIDWRTLAKHTRGLLGKIVELEMKPRQYMQFVLFTKAYYHLDEQGLAAVELTCSEEAQRLFFGIQEIGYLKYQLANVLSLTSKYSYLLYLYLKDNVFRECWKVSVEELRDKKLDLKNNECYKQFKYFKRDVLDKAIKEINEKTDISYEWKPIKRGRTVTHIEFKYIKPDENELVGQLSFEELPEPQPKVPKIVEESENMPEIVDDEELRLKRFDGDEELSILSEAVKDEFSVEDITHIREILRRIPDIQPDKNLGTGHWAMVWGRAAYLREQYAKLNATSKKKLINGGKGINDRCAYFKQMLEKAAKGE